MNQIRVGFSGWVGFGDAGTLRLTVRTTKDEAGNRQTAD